MLNWLRSLEREARPYAQLWLMVSITGGLIVYALWIVRPAPLLTLYATPHLDLLKMLDTDPLAQRRLLLAFGLLAVHYAVGWWACKQLGPGRSREAWVFVLGGAAAAAVLLTLLYPFDANDIYDNIMHGRILGIYGENPFLKVTRDFPDDPLAVFPAWKSSPSAYGPLWEYLAALTARLAGDGVLANVVAFKLLPGLFAAASVGLVAAFVCRDAADRALPAVWLLAWNPLVLYETFGHGHNDMVMVACVLAAALAAQRRRFTLATLALLAGALVKYIPVLLLPVLGALALRALPRWGERLSFMARTGLVAGAAAVAAYAPVWFGWETLSVDRRTRLFTSSLPSMIFHQLETMMAEDSAARIVSVVAAGLTALFALWMAVRAYREARPADREPAYGRLFAWASLAIVLFYLLVSVLWFHQWYLVWAVGLAVLLPGGPLAQLALFSSFGVMSKPLVMGPLVFYWMETPPQRELEWMLSAGTMGPSWLAALWLWGRRFLARNRAR